MLLQAVAEDTNALDIMGCINNGTSVDRCCDKKVGYLVRSPPIEGSSSGTMSIQEGLETGLAWLMRPD